MHYWLENFRGASGRGLHSCIVHSKWFKGKTFAIGWKTANTTKVFTLESFAIYSNKFMNENVNQHHTHTHTDKHRYRQTQTDRHTHTHTQISTLWRFQLLDQIWLWLKYCLETAPSIPPLSNCTVNGQWTELTTALRFLKFKIIQTNYLAPELEPIFVHRIYIGTRDSNLVNEWN